MPDEDSKDSDNAADNKATERESEEENEIRFLKVPKKVPAETEAPPSKKGKGRKEKKVTKKNN